MAPHFRRYNSKQAFKTRPVWQVACMAAAVWLIAITLLHFKLNHAQVARDVVKMGYMPVITNLACPLLDYATKDGDGLWFEAIKFASFAEMAEALRNEQIQAAFMIAPLAIVLRQQGEKVKVVYIGNRNESTLVVRKDLDAKDFTDLKGRTLAVPMRYSGHNILALELAEKYGIRGMINIVEMNPPDMAPALASGSLDAYCVGEPFAAQTLFSDESKVLYRVETLWPDFICNLLVVREDFMERYGDRLEKLVHGAARSGIWAENHIKRTAEIASMYWNQPADLVEFALTHPAGRIEYEKYMPKAEELKDMAEKMVQLGLLSNSDISGLVDDRFAKSVSLNGITDLKSILEF